MGKITVSDGMYSVTSLEERLMATGLLTYLYTTVNRQLWRDRTVGSPTFWYTGR
jgi:hypothetical protein